MITDLEKVKLLIGEENYNLLLKNGYFPIFIDSFKEMVDSKYGNNQLKSKTANFFIDKNNMYSLKEPNVDLEKSLIKNPVLCRIFSCSTIGPFYGITLIRILCIYVKIYIYKMVKKCNIDEGLLNKNKGWCDLNFILIFFFLFVSTIVSVLTLIKKNNKWLARLFAFCINTLFLVVVTWILYIINDEARVFGFGHTNLYILIFSIPIITWINFLILEFVRSRGIRTKKNQVAFSLNETGLFYNKEI